MNEKTIVITGASSGIGFALANALADKKHRVYGCSRSYPKQPFSFNHKYCDVSKEADIVNFYNQLVKEVKAIDVLIHCAGIGIGGALEETNLKDVQKIFQVNVFSVHLTTQIFLPLLRKSTQPKIINIGSVAGMITIPFQTLYSMTKAALSMYSEGLRMELKPFKIGVTTVLPGDTKTEFTAHRAKKIEENSPYQARLERSLSRMEKDERHGMSVDKVVSVVEKQMQKKRMKIYVTVGFKNKLIVLLSKLLPARIKMRIIYRLYAK